MRKTILLSLAVMLLFATTVLAQLNVPRTSPKSTITQDVGDTKVEIVYHRPNMKGRSVFGELVPYGQVWRTGANNATVFEVTNDVMINGKKLPAGKYSLYTIPGEDEWTIIFNKTWDQWGTVYKEEEDALRVTAKPMLSDPKETMSFLIEDVADNTANVIIAWDKVRVPFKVDVGDVSARIINQAQTQMVGTPITAANYVLSAKLTDKYPMALSWLDDSLEMFETYGALFVKSRLLNEIGKTEEAIATAEKAIALGKKQERNTTFLEGLVADWKAGK